MSVGHQIPVDPSQPGHGASREHIQDHFLCRSGLHACGPSDHLRAHFSNDGQGGSLLQWRIPIARDGDGLGSAAASVLNGGHCKRSPPTGGDSDHDITLARLLLGHLALAQFGGVFVGLNRDAKSFGPAGDHKLNCARITVEGRRTLGCIEGGNTATGPSAHVDQAATFFQSSGNEIDPTCDLR